MGNAHVDLLIVYAGTLIQTITESAESATGGAWPGCEANRGVAMTSFCELDNLTAAAPIVFFAHIDTA